MKWKLRFPVAACFMVVMMGLHIFSLVAFAGTADREADSLEDDIIEFTENDVLLNMPGRNFRFMLDNVNLMVMLSRELGISRISAEKTDEGSRYATSTFRVLFRHCDRTKDGYRLSFGYEAGLAAPLPVETAGSGTIMVRLKELKEKGTVADVDFSLKPSDRAMDSVVKKLPFFIKSYFKGKMEDILRDARRLSDVMEDDPQFIFEVLEYDDAPFTREEKGILRKFLSRRNIS